MTDASFPAPATTVVTCPPCVFCHTSAEVEVPVDAFHRWQNGELAQRAFPEMPAENREMLITGTHPKCWDDAFAEEED